MLLPSSCFVEHTLKAVCVLPEYQPGRKYNTHSYLCGHLNVLYVFDPTCIVLMSGWSSTARMPRLVVSPASLSLSLPDATRPMTSSLHFTPPIAKFQLARRRLCEALLSSSLVRNTSFCCLVYEICRRYEGRFALNNVMKIKSVVTFADRQRRSQFEHDHGRRADRAPQITASFTRDTQRARWHM